jgi:hypothetical protein
VQQQAAGGGIHPVGEPGQDALVLETVQLPAAQLKVVEPGAFLEQVAGPAGGGAQAEDEDLGGAPVRRQWIGLARDGIPQPGIQVGGIAPAQSAVKGTGGRAAAR